MRTTIDIEDDLLQVAKEMARAQRLSVGKVVSHLLRRAMTGQVTMQTSDSDADKPTVAGFRPFSQNRKPVTDAQVNALRDEENI